MKPVTLPIAALLPFPVSCASLRRADLRRLRGALGLGDHVLGLASGTHLAERRHRLQADLRQGAFVLVREDLDEPAASLGPVIEDLARAQASGPLVMVRDQ